MGGELLPVAPLQPCSGAPSGRGYLFSGWVNLQLALCNYSSNNVHLAVQAWGTPLGMASCAEALIRWAFIRALSVHSLPTVAHYMVLCLYCTP